MTVLALGNIKIACCVRSSVTTFLLLFFVFILGVVIDHFVNFSGSSSFLLSLPIQGLLPVLFFFFFLVVVWVVLFFVSDCIGWWWWWVGGVELRFNLGFGENTPYWDAWQPDLLLLLLL